MSPPESELPQQCPVTECPKHPSPLHFSINVTVPGELSGRTRGETMATKCAINGRQWGAYDGRRHTRSTRCCEPGSTPKTIIPTTRVRRPHAHSSMNVPRTTVYGHLNTRTRAASSSAVPVNMVGCGPCCGDAVAADLPLRLRAEHQSRRRPPTRGPSWFGHRPISLRPVRTAAGLRCRVRGVRRRAESSPAISPRPPTVVMVFRTRCAGGSQRADGPYRLSCGARITPEG